MTAQQIVAPDHIESGLIKLWEEFSQEKTRACLFNLIVFNQLSDRTDYIRDIVRAVSEKYPCRVLFISSDPASANTYLKTAISLVGDGTIACDCIDIGVAGADLEKVPFLLLPHIIPDLPVSLLWTEDPSLPHPLFQPLLKLATRVIFDSESADNLLTFAKTLLQFNTIDIADLNWARTERWRDLIASLFRSEKQARSLREIQITYNGKKTESFCHLKVQSIYLLTWLAAQGKIVSAEWDTLGPGALISVEITTADGQHYQCTRNPRKYNQVNIQISSSEKCELPYQFVLGPTASGHSLVKEIITKGTSQQYLNVLQNLERNFLC